MHTRLGSWVAASRPATRAAALAWSLAATAALLAVGSSVAVVARAVAIDDGAGLLSHQALRPLATLGFGGLGALLAARRPGHAVGWLLIVVGLASGLGLLGFAAGAGWAPHAAWLPPRLAPWLAWLDLWIWVPGVFLPTAFLFLYFPGSRLPSRRRRRVTWAAWAGLAGMVVGLALHPGPAGPWSVARNPWGLATAEPALGVLVDACGALLMLALATGTATLAVRLRRAARDRRRHLRGVVAAAAVLLACLSTAAILRLARPDAPFASEAAMALTTLGTLGVAAAAGLAVLRHGLDGAGVPSGRALAYAALSALVLALYVVAVGGLGLIFHARGGLAGSLLATGIVAALLQPLRERLQRGASRLVYRERYGPHAVPARLGPCPVEADRPEPGGRLLAAGARQGSASADRARLIEELRRSRASLAATREEERRRVRRDLHDGLGPALAAMSLRVEAARNLLRSRDLRVESLLEELDDQIVAAVADIRRLVYGLRPPALDDLGLLEALREQAHECRRRGLRVEVRSPPELPPLAAELEVAAFRIAQESLTNVLRHARAGHCVVTVSAGDELRITVEDDGCGLPTGMRPGVGLSSMRERVAELGGAVEVRPGVPRGTLVEAQLPIRENP